jgi:hypothetical protein
MASSSGDHAVAYYYILEERNGDWQFVRDPFDVEFEAAYDGTMAEALELPLNPRADPTSRHDADDPVSCVHVGLFPIASA